MQLNAVDKRNEKEDFNVGGKGNATRLNTSEYKRFFHIFYLVFV